MLELSCSLQDFNAAMKAMVEVHNLTPGDFDWIEGRVRHAMEPQVVMELQALASWPWRAGGYKVDYFTSSITVYGGKIANREGGFHFGHVVATINEPTPPGVKYQSDFTKPAAPYIPHVLTIHNGIVKVKTLVKEPPASQEPVVFEGNEHKRFATVTCYNPTTGALTARSGFIASGGSRANDKTIDEDAHRLPQEVLADRVATMTRTLAAATDILRKIAQKDDTQATWSISTDYKP